MQVQLGVSDYKGLKYELASNCNLIIGHKSPEHLSEYFTVLLDLITNRNLFV